MIGKCWGLIEFLAGQKTILNPIIFLGLDVILNAAFWFDQKLISLENSIYSKYSDSRLYFSNQVLIFNSIILDKS